MEVRRLMAKVFTILIPTKVSEAVQNHLIVSRINMKTRHGTEEVKRRRRNEVRRIKMDGVGLIFCG
ncbi:hypothetical protein E2C01_017888 [Portunus trituberculatus]|uniref:Uncharacterized protein n=1 Tax=Portunus trituberculatus TaxID=210409 RepID=A0A5B7DV15_PORTR|nr:hypothetical protein [Portunus trituberculatus]